MTIRHITKSLRTSHITVYKRLLGLLQIVTVHVTLQWYGYKAYFKYSQ